MNTKNSKTNKLHRLKLKLADKIDLKNPNKIMKLANLSIYYTWKYIKSTYNNNKFKILLQLGTMNLICLMDHTLIQTFKIILITLLKNMRL